MCKLNNLINVETINADGGTYFKYPDGRLEFMSSNIPIPGEPQGGVIKTYSLFTRIYSVLPISRHGDGLASRYTYNTATNGASKVSVSLSIGSNGHSSQLFIYGRWN